MKILVNEKISQHKYKTPEGYLICVDSVLARTGNQTYRKNELFVDSEDDSEIEVGRSPEEVFSAETLASFENKPITIEHPDEDVNIENYKDYAVGFVRDVKQGKFDGQDVILGTLVITDKDAIEGIENGEHVELSCGYDCDIEDGADGYQQKHIRGNHVALCEAGRAGIAKIIDSVGDEDTVKYKGYTLKFHKGYNMWLNMKDYYEVFDERGNKVAMKKDLKSAKEYVDNGGFKDSVEVNDRDMLVTKEVDDKTFKGFCDLLYGEYIRTPNAYSSSALLIGRKKSQQVFISAFASQEPPYTARKTDPDANVEIGVTIDYNYGARARKDWKFDSFDELRRNSRKLIDYANELYRKATVGDAEVKDAKKYAVEFVYEGDSISDYLGNVWVYANSEKEALKKAEQWAKNKYDDAWNFKIVPKAYSNSDVIDAIEDAGEPRLDRAQRRMLQNYLSMISTFTSRDTDIQDVLRPLAGKGFKYTIDKIEGWIWKKGEMAYKNYYISLDGYRDTFKVTLYADPNKDWKVTEVNAYFTDSKVKDETPEEEQITMLEKDLKHFEDEEVNDAELNWKKTYLGEETDEIRLPHSYGSIIASYDDIRKKTRIRFLGGSRGSSRDDVYVKGKPKTVEQLLKYAGNSINDAEIPNWFESLYYEACEKYGKKDYSSQLRYISRNTSLSQTDEKTMFKWLKQLRTQNEKVKDANPREIQTIIKAANNVFDEEDLNKVLGSLLSVDQNLYKKYAQLAKNKSKKPSYLGEMIAEDLYTTYMRDSMVKDADWTITIDFPKDTIVNMSFMARGENDESNKIIPWVNTFATIKDHSATMTMKPKKTIYISDLAYKLGAKLAKDFVRDIESQVKNGKIKDDDGFTIEDASNFKYHSVYPFTKGLRFFVNGQQIKSVGQYTIDGIDCYIGNKAFNIPLIDTQTKDSIHDVDPRSGESKDDFIARFMKETKNEYPDEKQRLAVAYSYWERKGRDSKVKDINPDYQNCLRELDKDVNQLYKLYQHGDKAPSTILHNMGYKEVGDDRFMMRSGLNKMIIEFDDFNDYIKYYVVDESGKIPKGYTVSKMKFYDSKAKDSIYALTIQGQKSKKLVRAKDAREAIDKYTKMFPKHKVNSVKKTDKFNNIVEIITR